MRHFRLYLLILLWLLLGLLGYGLVRQLPTLQHLAAHSQPDLPQYPGTDWVVWADSPDGPVVERVLPPARSNEWQMQDYLQPGDVLATIDYTPIPNAELAHTLSRAAAPGTVRLYQVLRRQPGQLTPTQLNIFVQTTYKPVLLFAENNTLFQGYLLYLVLLGGISLSLLVLLLPFYRTRSLGVRPLLVLLGLLVLLALWQALRHLVLAIDLHYRWLEWERVAFAVAALLWILIASQSLWVSLRLPLWLRLPGLLAGLALWGWLLWQIGDVFIPYQLWAYQALMGYFTIHIVVAALAQWRPGGRLWPRLLLLLAIGLSVLAVGIALWDVWTMEADRHTRLWYYAGLQLMVLLPVGLAARNIVEYGNLSLVLSRTFALALGLSAMLVAYLLLDQLLEAVLGSALNRGLIEIVVLFLLVLLLRYLYLRNKGWFNRMLPLINRREHRLQTFMERIPRYTGSTRLADDLATETAEYLNATLCEVHTDEHSTAPLTEEDSRLLAEVNLHLTTHPYWSSAKQLYPYTLPPHLEQWLLARGIRLVFSFQLTNERLGLLLLGAKKGGVYNLGDTEVLSRLVIQARLSLEILYLLEREKELVQKNLEANLAALRSQINPHFLFNTLNTIADLIHSSPNLAEKAVEKLAFIFRYTLRVSGANFVPLKDELALVRNYLDIEQIRFGDRLNVEFDIEPETEEVPIPAFVLQTLVENCIKHGTAKILANGLVRISAAMQDGWMVCTVYDNGPGIDAARVEKGTGLRNILTRMRNLYNRDDLLTFTNVGNGTLVTLKIPPDYEQDSRTDS